MRPSLLRMGLLGLALGLSGVAFGAQQYFVAPTGLDTGNTGLSGSPFREIRKALTVVSAGDTIFVADGQYKGFDVNNIVGNANSPITIQAQGTGAQVNVTTDRGDNRDTIFVTNGSTYVVIDGLRALNGNRSSLRVDQCNHITVRNCVFGNNATWGLFTDFADDLLLENNECYGSVAEHGIYVSNSCTRPTVRGNRLHDNHANGLHMNGDLSQGAPGIITNALVENNIIYGNGAGGGSGINCDGVQNSVIQNNLIYAAHGAGISLYMIDAAQPSINNVVANNTIDVASNGKWALQIHSGSSGTVMFNNIFLTNNTARGSVHFEGPTDLQGLVSDYNIFTTQAHAVTPDDDTSFYTLAQWQGQGFDTHSFTSTQAALFVDPAADFHLLSTAPALDKGVASLSGKSAPAKDRDGIARPQNAVLDIGSYERVVPGSGGGGPTIDTSPAAGANPATVGVAVSFSIGVSSPGPLTYAWNFGDGSSSSAVAPSHMFSTAGTYTVSVTVTDANGSSSASMSLTVNAASGGGGGGGGGSSGGADTDGDGVSDSDELAQGTDPNSATSFPTTPMTVSKLRGSAKLSTTGKDSCSTSGVVPALPALFDPTGKTALIDIAGAQVSFTLDAKGKAKGANGTLALKMKFKRNKQTKKLEFLGGDVPLTVSLRNGNFSSAWSNHGLNFSADAKKQPASVVADLHFNGKVYRSSVNVLLSVKAGKSGAFKK
jgi:hypothetical protein